jgi:branched-chain amino acid transport system substrate-binding protein
VPTNKKMGVLWPNDPDGLAFADPKTGFGPALKQQGFTVVDPGRFNHGNDDFSSQISKFKSAGVELISGVLVPPDFATFWSQAAQQGFKPKVATIAKAILFPSAVDALGGKADGLATEVWWSNKHPFKSSLTGQSAADLAAAYLVALGVVAVAIAVWVPQGIWGWIAQRYDVSLFPLRRRFRP